MEFFSHQTSYPFMATRRVWYTLSAVLMIVSLASFFTRAVNLTIDFTGGVSAEVRFPHAANVDEVRTRLAAAGFREPQVQNFGSSRDIAIRMPRIRSRRRPRFAPAWRRRSPASTRPRRWRSWMSSARRWGASCG